MIWILIILNAAICGYFIFDVFKLRILYEDLQEYIENYSNHTLDKMLTPCDMCKYNPPSSKDGKPCSICPAICKE